MKRSRTTLADSSDDEPDVQTLIAAAVRRAQIATRKKVLAEHAARAAAAAPEAVAAPQVAAAPQEPQEVAAASQAPQQVAAPAPEPVAAEGERYAMLCRRWCSDSYHRKFQNTTEPLLEQKLGALAAVAPAMAANIALKTGAKIAPVANASLRINETTEREYRLLGLLYRKHGDVVTDNEKAALVANFHKHMTALAAWEAQVQAPVNERMVNAIAARDARIRAAVDEAIAKGTKIRFPASERDWYLVIDAMQRNVSGHRLACVHRAMMDHPPDAVTREAHLADLAGFTDEQIEAAIPTTATAVREGIEKGARDCWNNVPDRSPTVELVFKDRALYETLVTKLGLAPLEAPPGQANPHAAWTVVKERLARLHAIRAQIATLIEPTPPFAVLAKPFPPDSFGLRELIRIGLPTSAVGRLVTHLKIVEETGTVATVTKFIGARPVRGSTHGHWGKRSDPPGRFPGAVCVARVLTSANPTRVVVDFPYHMTDNQGLLDRLKPKEFTRGSTLGRRLKARDASEDASLELARGRMLYLTKSAYRGYQAFEAMFGDVFDLEVSCAGEGELLSFLSGGLQFTEFKYAGGLDDPATFREVLLDLQHGMPAAPIAKLCTKPKLAALGLADREALADVVSDAAKIATDEKRTNDVEVLDKLAVELMKPTDELMDAYGAEMAEDLGW